MQTSRTSLAAPVIRTGVLALNITLMIAAVSLMAYYVVQANALAAFQYDIGANESGIMELREQHHIVSAEVAELEHSDRIAGFADSAGMVLAADAAYVSIPESPVARRQ